MADDTRKVRVEEQLKIKIGEAKQLVGRNGGTSGTTGSNSRDVYCTIALDQEEICRTPTIEKNLNPFFGEEYQFQIPRKFRYLSVYVWDRDKHLKQDKTIGKIAIRREELHVYNHKDHWFPLRPVDADSEVQGMAHIIITIDNGTTDNLIKQEYQQIIQTTSSTPSTNNTSGTSPTTTITQQQQQSTTINKINSLNYGNNSSSDYKENSIIEQQQQHQHQQYGINKLDIGLTGGGGGVGIGSGLGGVIGGGGVGAGSLTKNIFGQNDWTLQQQQQQINQNYFHPNHLHNIRNNHNSEQQQLLLQTIQQQQQQQYNCTNKNRLTIKVDELIDLTKKNGNCDPYIIITGLYSNKRKIIKRTKTKKKTVNPIYDEIFYYDLNIEQEQKTDSNNVYTVVPLGGADLCELLISVWHDTPGIGENIFLGEIKLQMRGKQQQNSLQQTAWYFLQPRTSQQRPVRSCATPPGTRLSCDNSLGSLRLKLNYTADHVFPLATYDQLMNLLLMSLEYKPITSSCVYILGEIVTNKMDIARPLVRLFTYKNLIVNIIKLLADYEISKLTDPTTIFRGNTLVSKMMDEAMRLSGLHYLHNTLRPIVEEILHDKKPCEIDPTKVKDKNVIEQNLLNLYDYLEKIFIAITKSAVKCPTVLCQIFHDLRESAAKHFPMNKEVRYSVVSGFIFLRFFAPAILGPKLFDLTTEPLDAQTNRTLTLISKTIQSLGNLVSSRSAQQPCKEEYTGQLYKKFFTEKHIDAVKHFLEVISTVGASVNGDTLLEPVLLKEGMMTKRAQGRKRFGRRNFKQRYFRLTTQSLSYAKSKGKRPICDIPLSEILAVERLTERSFKMQNIFQIIRRERPLYVQTANCVEEKEWVDLLSKICQSNAQRLENFHPCAYINGIWTCCKESDQYAKGCTSVTPKPFQVELGTALDPAKDLQRLHSLIMSHLNELEKLGNPTQYKTTGTITDDLIMCRKTLQSIIDTAIGLEQIHRKYKNMLSREMKYGSRQAPIGDDNYLHMIRGPGKPLIQQHQQHQQQQHHHQQNMSPIFFHRDPDNDNFSQC